MIITYVSLILSRRIFVKLSEKDGVEYDFKTFVLSVERFDFWAVPSGAGGPSAWASARIYGGTVRNASCTIVDLRNGSGDGDMATMMVVVDDGSGGGKYGTPGAGVIIYLAPEIGPADTAGRFNGRIMLELTKTKTKHQLGDFFFHFSFASFTFAHHSVSFFLTLPFFLRVRFTRFSSVTSKRGAAKVRTMYMRGPPIPSLVNFFSHQR